MTDYKTDDADAKSTDDAAIILECRARMEQCDIADADFRRAALDDLAFVAGDHWDQRTKESRAREGRPCLTSNKLPSMLRQVTNSNRRNIPSIIVHPATSDAKARKRADVLQGAIRHVEYASQASVAYDTAVSSAAHIGKGFFRVVTEYEKEDSFDQVIAFKRIRNAFTVYADPADSTLDGAGMTWCIISSKMARSDFKAQHPDAEPCNFDGDKHTSNWVTDAEVRVAEYYRINFKAEKVALLADGRSMFESEVPAGGRVVRTRPGNRRIVEWFKLTANEILERSVVPSKWIPVFPVYGDELDVDGNVQYSGMVRHAKDTARMYNFWLTTATEEVAMRPKTPYIGAEGQFKGHEAKWNTAGTRNHNYLEYKPVMLSGVMAPPPQRQPMADMPGGVMQMAAMVSDDLKVITSVTDASMGMRSNETSGRAIIARDKQGETANSHFIDNLHTTLRHACRVVLDMWPKVYDGTRTLRVMGEDGKVATADVNVPTPGRYGETVAEWLNDMGTHDMTVTVRAGPSYDTMRQEAVEGMIATAQSWPKFMEVAGDKVVRSMDWPMADQIADRIEKSMPPELRDRKEGEPENVVQTPKGPMPIDKVGPMLAQMEQQMQEMGDALEASKSGLDKARIDAESRVRVAEINATSRQDVEELKGYIAMLQMKQQESEEAMAGMQQAALTPAADQPERNDEVRGMLEQLLQAQTAPKPPAPRKRMRIVAPSGEVYEREIGDDAPMPEDQPPEPMLGDQQPEVI